MGERDRASPIAADLSEDQLQARFPDLEFHGVVGRGGMGVVYKAKQPRLDRWVALKVLPVALAGAPDFRERFVREAQVLARLQHPRIVSLHDFGEVEGTFFLLMEFVDGASLRGLMTTGRISPAQTLEIIPQVCDALAFAHQDGVVHRDVKPENILIDSQGAVKIADFGLAKVLGANMSGYSLTGSGQRLGTPHYMAPEQLNPSLGTSDGADARADIYSLGVVFYEMLTGHLPLGRFGPPSQQSEVGSRVDDVVMKTLEPDPSKRFQEVGQVSEGLEGAGAPASVDQATRRRIRERARSFRGGRSRRAIAPEPWPTSARWALGVFLASLSALMSAKLLMGLLAEKLADAAVPLPAIAVGPVALISLMGLSSAVAWFAVLRSRRFGIRGGIGVSVFIALAPWLAALDVILCRPLADIDDQNVSGILSLIFVPALLAANVWIYRRVCRWAVNEERE